MANLNDLTPRGWREQFRLNTWHGNTTSGLAPGYVQCNLAIVPKSLARDFKQFCLNNPAPCPVVEQLDPGEFLTQTSANQADIRTDLPKYHIIEKGKITQTVNDITPFWQSDFVTFLIGCSYSFEHAMQELNLPVRHVEENKRVPVYVTNIQTNPSGAFHGPLVVSMRPIPKDKIEVVEQLTEQFSIAHGAPIHVGDPGKIGISNLNQPDYNDAVTIHKNEIPVFWACGVTPIEVAKASTVPLMITHVPSFMFLSDQKITE